MVKQKTVAKRTKRAAPRSSLRRPRSDDESEHSEEETQVFQPNKPKNFVSADARVKYQSLANRYIVYGHRVVLEDVCRGGLRIREMLDTMGWTELVTRKI